MKITRKGKVYKRNGVWHAELPAWDWTRHPFTKGNYRHDTWLGVFLWCHREMSLLCKEDPGTTIAQYVYGEHLQ